MGQIKNIKLHIVTDIKYNQEIKNKPQCFVNQRRKAHQLRKQLKNGEPDVMCSSSFSCLLVSFPYFASFHMFSNTLSPDVCIDSHEWNNGKLCVWMDVTILTITDFNEFPCWMLFLIELSSFLL